MAAVDREALLDSIYDAALDPGRWESVILGITAATGSVGGVLQQLSLAPRAAVMTVSGGLDPELVRICETRYLWNPLTAAAVQRRPGEISHSDEVIALAGLRATDFYADVLRPHDIGHNAAASIDRDGGASAILFNLCRSERQGALDQEGVRLVTSLLPHLRRAFGLRSRAEHCRALGQADFAAIELLAIGAVILDAAGRLLFANAAARRIAADSGALQLTAGGLAARWPSQDAALQRLIARSLAGQPAAALSLPAPERDCPLVLLASPLRGRTAERLGGALPSRAAAIVFVTTAGDRRQPNTAWLAEAFGLTPAEARAAAALAEGRDFAATASGLGIQATTLKTHARRIFEKAGCRRRAEFLQLVATAFPLADGAEGAVGGGEPPAPASPPPARPGG